MDRKVPGVFRDITDECGGDHSADIDRESKSGLGQKPREDRSETNCKDKLEDCGCGTYCRILLKKACFHYMMKKVKII